MRAALIMPVLAGPGTGLHHATVLDSHRILLAEQFRDDHNEKNLYDCHARKYHRIAEVRTIGGRKPVCVSENARIPARACHDAGPVFSSNWITPLAETTIFSSRSRSVWVVMRRLSDVRHRLDGYPVTALEFRLIGKETERGWESKHDS